MWSIIRKWRLISQKWRPNCPKWWLNWEKNTKIDHKKWGMFLVQNWKMTAYSWKMMANSQKWRLISKNDGLFRNDHKKWGIFCGQTKITAYFENGRSTQGIFRAWLLTGDHLTSHSHTNGFRRFQSRRWPVIWIAAARHNQQDTWHKMYTPSVQWSLCPFLPTPFVILFCHGLDS